MAKPFASAMFTGTCRCGHKLHEHHNPVLFSAEHAAKLSPGVRPYAAEECKHYGVNEFGGLGPDLRVHCARYVDRADPDPPTERGTFTRRARARAWFRFCWQVIQVRVLGRAERQVFRRERW
jgi:hypothetical protein